MGSAATHVRRRVSSDSGRLPSVALVAAGGAIMCAGVLAACTPGNEGDGIDLFAAASLADVVEALSDEFTATTGIEVRLNVAGSSTLRLQIEEGASADVFLPAAPAHIEQLTEVIAGDPTSVATNRLVSAHHVDAEPIGLEQFADADLLLGACAPAVPCGAYAQQAFDAAGLDPSLDTLEPNVRALAAKIGDEALDAGLVYATDVSADSRLAAVELAEPVIASYSVVQLAQANDPDAAAEFIAFLTSDAGQQTFAEYGFGAP